jgi:hypothetical protein
MTVCFPPLIKPDGRFSRIRLSEFLASQPEAATPAWGFNSRTFLALIAFAVGDGGGGMGSTLDT